MLVEFMVDQSGTCLAQHQVRKTCHYQYPIMSDILSNMVCLLLLIISPTQSLIGGVGTSMLYFKFHYIYIYIYIYIIIYIYICVFFQALL